MTHVIAFDIDGALTKNEGEERYRELLRTDAKVGIVSARDIDDVMKFMLDNDIEADFVKSTTLKGQALRRVKHRYKADSTIYYGSWFRDRIHANIAGWEYRQV